MSDLTNAYRTTRPKSWVFFRLGLVLHLVKLDYIRRYIATKQKRSAAK
jgi:hypothetical protein